MENEKAASKGQADGYAKWSAGIAVSRRETVACEFNDGERDIRRSVPADTMPSVLWLVPPHLGTGH